MGYGDYWVQFAPAAVAPQHQARSNISVIQELARRMGLTDPLFSMTEREIFPAFFRNATGSVASIDPTSLLDHRPVKAAPPPGQEFRTRSGKLEIYAQALADQGVTPCPDWQPDPDEVADAARWAAPAAHRTVLLPAPHHVLRCRVPAPSRRRALLRPASRGCRPAGPRGRAEAEAV